MSYFFFPGSDGSPDLHFLVPVIHTDVRPKKGPTVGHQTCHDNTDRTGGVGPCRRYGRLGVHRTGGDPSGRTSDTRSWFYSTSTTWDVYSHVSVSRVSTSTGPDEAHPVSVPKVQDVLPPVEGRVSAGDSPQTRVRNEDVLQDTSERTGRPIRRLGRVDVEGSGREVVTGEEPQSWDVSETTRSCQRNVRTHGETLLSRPWSGIRTTVGVEYLGLVG